jgi:hypothetical protein
MGEEFLHLVFANYFFLQDFCHNRIILHIRNIFLQLLMIYLILAWRILASYFVS